MSSASRSPMRYPLRHGATTFSSTFGVMISSFLFPVPPVLFSRWCGTHTGEKRKEQKRKKKKSNKTTMTTTKKPKNPRSWVCFGLLVKKTRSQNKKERKNI
uniref:Uncharacterized protein n=1 Tax=Mustela putorius furo TaxID=9669 RepID=M3Z1P7_MUSPF